MTAGNKLMEASKKRLKRLVKRSKDIKVVKMMNLSLPEAKTPHEDAKLVELAATNSVGENNCEEASSTHFSETSGMTAPVTELAAQVRQIESLLNSELTALDSIYCPDRSAIEEDDGLELELQQLNESEAALRDELAGWQLDERDILVNLIKDDSISKSVEASRLKPSLPGQQNPIHEKESIRTASPVGMVAIYDTGKQDLSGLEVSMSTVHPVSTISLCSSSTLNLDEKEEGKEEETLPVESSSAEATESKSAMPPATIEDDSTATLDIHFHPDSVTPLTETTCHSALVTDLIEIESFFDSLFASITDIPNGTRPLVLLEQDKTDDKRSIKSPLVIQLAVCPTSPSQDTAQRSKASTGIMRNWQKKERKWNASKWLRKTIAKRKPSNQSNMPTLLRETELFTISEVSESSWQERATEELPVTVMTPTNTVVSQPVLAFTTSVLVENDDSDCHDSDSLSNGPVETNDSEIIVRSLAKDQAAPSSSNGTILLGSGSWETVLDADDSALFESGWLSPEVLDEPEEESPALLPSGSWETASNVRELAPDLVSFSIKTHEETEGTGIPLLSTHSFSVLHSLSSIADGIVKDALTTPELDDWTQQISGVPIFDDNINDVCTTLRHKFSKGSGSPIILLWLAVAFYLSVGFDGESGQEWAIVKLQTPHNILSLPASSTLEINVIHPIGSPHHPQPGQAGKPQAPYHLDSNRST